MIPADITNYEYFESQKQSLLVRKQDFLVRNSFQELAVENANIAILFQQLNYFYFEGTTHSMSRILPSMIDLLRECFDNNKLDLLQSVIRINHLTAEQYSSINLPVRQMWSAFADIMLMVKQFKLKRPNLNMIECAILSTSRNEKWEAVIVAISQCLMACVLVLHVMIPQSGIDDDDELQCDVYSICKNIINMGYSSTWYDGCLKKCYWRVDFSFMMTIIAVVMVILKVVKQVDDQQKFRLVFEKLIMDKSDFFEQFLLILDIIVNVILPIFLVILTFMLISKSDEVTDLVLNCVALTFIVKLDDDLNKRDTVEIDDLLNETFKKLLLSKCKQLDEEHHGKSNNAFTLDNNFIRNPFVSADNSTDSKSLKANAEHHGKSNIAFTFDNNLIRDQLVSADYSTDSKSLKANSEVLSIVKSYIDKGRLLPAVNSIFGDPHYGKRKYLVLQFKGNIVISVTEHLIVDFSVIEKMLKTKNGNYQPEASQVAPSLRSRMQVIIILITHTTPENIFSML